MPNTTDYVTCGGCDYQFIDSTHDGRCDNCGAHHTEFRCSSCGALEPLLNLHELTGQCPTCFDSNAKRKHPGDHHPIVHALMSASYAAFDLGFYAKSDGFADEAAIVRGIISANPNAYKENL